MTTIQEFDQYLDKCKICGDQMTLLAEFDILTNSFLAPDYFDFQMAGSLVFFYDGNGKFTKGCFLDDMHKGIAEKVYDKTICSFTIKKRVYPHLHRRKIIDAIQPLGLDAIPLTITKECIKHKSHVYGYRTGIIDEFDNANPNVLDINNEFLQIHDHQVMNVLKNNKPDYTQIIEWGTKNPLNDIRLPIIAFDMWNINSREAFVNQLEKFSMLL
jgi:hypothetical protein